VSLDRIPTPAERDQILTALALLLVVDDLGFAHYICGYTDGRIARLVAYDLSEKRVARMRRQLYGKLRPWGLPWLPKPRYNRTRRVLAAPTTGEFNEQ
jgi:hypothetical protein